MMKKTFKRVTSVIMAALVSLSPMSGFVIPMTVHAEEINIALADCTYDEEGTAIVLKSYTGSGNKVDETSLVEEIQKTKPSITDVEIGSEFWSTYNGDITVGTGVKLHGKPTTSTTVTAIKFEGDNGLDGVEMNDFFKETFKDWTSLTKVEGLENILKSANASDISNTVSLDKTFSGCTALTEFKLDMTSSNNWVQLSETFYECSLLKKIDIKSTHIAKLESLNQSAKTCPAGIKVSVSDCTFAGSDTSITSPMYAAFNGMSGTFTFQNCDSTSNDGVNMNYAFSKTQSQEYKESDLGARDVTVVVENTKVNSVKGLLSGTYGNVDLTNLVTADTKDMSNMIAGTYKNIRGISTWNTSNVTDASRLLYNFKGTTQSVTDSVISDLKKLDYTNIKSYTNLYFISDDTVDMSGVVLSSDASAIYKFETLTDVDFFTTPKTFGGKYYNKVKFYSIDSKTGEYTEVTPDDETEELGMKYYVYNSSTLKPETKYSIASSVIKIVDVAKKDATPTFRYFAPGTVALDVLDSSVSYFTDEELKTAITRSTVTSKSDPITVYFTSDTGSTEEPGTDKPGDDEKKDDEKELEYSVTMNLPDGMAAEFTTDPTLITATLEDGTTRKLAQNDGDVIKVTLKQVIEPDSYAQSVDFGNYMYKRFYTMSISITNGDKTYSVKSLSESIKVRLYELFGEFDSHKVAVYTYPNGLTKSPKLVDSSVVSNKKIDTRITNMSNFVLLYYGERYTDNYYHYDVYINWNDAGNETNRPKTVTGTWLATYQNGGKTQSDTFSITTDKKVYSQYVTINIPKGSDESGNPTSAKNYAYTNMTVNIPSISGYKVTKVDDSDFKWKLTYDPSSVIPEPVIDVPKGAKVEFSKQALGITATLTDGSTLPLVQAGYTTTVTINEDSVPSNYGKATGMDKFKGLKFYDITITINDGTKTHTVKSLDADVSIYLPKPDDFNADKGYKVYHYSNGISKVPEELTATVTTDGLIKVLTNSFSPYAVAYNGDEAATTTTKEIKLIWDDAGKESERPSSVVVDYVAKYADGTEKSYNVVFDKDTSTSTQTKSVEVPDKEGSSLLTGVTASVRNVTYYSISKDTSSDLAFKLKYTGNTAQVITSTFEVEFENDNAANRPAKVQLEVYCVYEDNSRETKTVTINVGSTGSGSVEVQFPIKNEAGSQYRSIRWDWPTITGYDLVGTGRVATYRYTGSTPATVQTKYSLTVKFSDTTDKTKRPSQIPITWTATTESGAVTTGTATVDVTTATDTFTTDVTVPAATNEKRTVVFTAPTLNGYGLQSAGTTFTYTLTAASTTANVEIIFDDSENKAGRRPEKLEFTLKDSSNESNTVTGSITIANNTTTTTKTYNATVNIPSGTTYAIKEVKNLPTGYTASYSGLSATLKYTPETVSKTYSVKFEGDAESVRPSSVTITVKSGDTTGSTLTVSKDTNWSATATLAKYIKGVEAAWTPSVGDVSNYSASVSGETITLKYTGTLTEAQKAEAAKAAGKDTTDATKEETENDLYNYDKFDWIDYANRYPDVKKAFGYNKEQLYAHYIHYGIAEGRVATFTGKYENVNEEILAAYFPNDYKYRVAVSGPLDDMANGTGSTVSGNTTVSTDGSGNTVIKKDNGDGTTTETVIDGEGNVVSTRTYTTGDFRTEALSWLYIAIALVALAIGGVYYYDFNKKHKTSKFIETTIKS